MSGCLDALLPLRPTNASFDLAVLMPPATPGAIFITIAGVETLLEAVFETTAGVDTLVEDVFIPLREFADGLRLLAQACFTGVGFFAPVLRLRPSAIFITLTCLVELTLFPSANFIAFAGVDELALLPSASFITLAGVEGTALLPSFITRTGVDDLILLPSTVFMALTGVEDLARVSRLFITLAGVDGSVHFVRRFCSAFFIENFIIAF